MLILDVAEELGALRLGDSRRNDRARAITRALQERPDSSFPEIFGEAELEGHYRLSNNKEVEPIELLRPHIAASGLRATTDGGYRLIVHDNTEFSFPGEKPRKGLVFSGKRNFFQGHFSLAVGLDEAPVVHGVVGARFFLVADELWQEIGENDEVKALIDGSYRWFDAVKAVHDTVPAGDLLVHVMDREADDYELFDAITGLGDAFVIRLAQNRRVEEPPGNVNGVLEMAPFILERSVHLSRRGVRRPPTELKRHPPREDRAARLSVRVGEVTIRRPKKFTKNQGSPSISLNLVEVVELEPPEGESPVHWRLLTTLPVATATDAARVVDFYRKRWLIEEYFKALKTGCAVETRQAESRHAILNTLALLIPIGVRLLQIRALARHSPDAPSTGMLGSVELQVLRAMAPRATLAHNPTNHQVMAALGLLGGHLKSNGEPGWQVLGRGLQRLLGFVDGWRAALAAAAAGAP